MFKYGFCLITKMATNMVATCQFAGVDTLIHLSPGSFQISYPNYFYQTLA